MGSQVAKNSAKNKAHGPPSERGSPSRRGREWFVAMTKGDTSTAGEEEGRERGRKKAVVTEVSAHLWPFQRAYPNIKFCT